MATTTYKTLGQLAAASAVAATESIYTVGTATGTQAIVSTVTVCNRGTASATYRLAIRPNGTAVSNQHYIAYDAPILGNDTVALTIGIALDANDILSAYASNANLTFNAFGAEIV